MLLGRVWRQLCTEDCVPADLTCCDSGVHLRFLLPADLHHHSNVRTHNRFRYRYLLFAFYSNVSGCYCYCYYIGPLIVRANLFLKIYLLIYDSGRWFSSGNGLFIIPASWMLPCRAVSPFLARWSLLLGWQLSNNHILTCCLYASMRFIGLHWKARSCRPHLLR
jgi:hypothetical protein